jgi:hypothetical protein
MTKIIRRKFMAIVLTLAMVMSLLPALTISAKAADKSYETTVDTEIAMNATDIFGVTDFSSLAGNLGGFWEITSGSASTMSLYYLKTDNSHENMPFGELDFNLGSYDYRSKIYFKASAQGTYIFTSSYTADGGENYEDRTIQVTVTGSSSAPTIADKTITASGITQTGAVLSWNKATDETSAQTALQYLAYQSGSNNLGSVANIEANGTPIDTYASDIATKTVGSLTAGTAYYFNVIVKDAAGNKTCYTAVPVTTTAAPDIWNGTMNTSWYTANPAAETFTISTAAQLAGLASIVNAGTDNFSGNTINLTSNIDLGSIQWTPIGNTDVTTGPVFAGIFNGNGHTVSNLAIGTSASANSVLANAGLFGFVYGGTIKNTGVLNVSIYYAGSRAGGLAGWLNGSTSEGVANTIENCYATGIVSGGNSSNTGGLVGVADYSTITKCYAAGSVFAGTDAYAGGLLALPTPAAL